MDVINAGMRKSIKTMCIVAQTAQFVSLMPKPKDFVTRIVGDVVYLSAKVQELSDKMNKLLDEYAEIPGNYLMTQMNSISGSLSRIANRVGTYTDNMVNQGFGLAENTSEMISEMTGLTIDAAGAATSAVVGLGSVISETSAGVMNNAEVAEDIHEGASIILEWANGGFRNLSDKSTEPLKTITQKLKNSANNASNTINKSTSTVTNTIEAAQEQVEKLITELREKMNKLASVMDTNFKDVTGLSSVSKGASTISQGLYETKSDDNASRVVMASANALSEVIKNFNIGKVVFAFSGVIAQSAIVRLGLDNLPPIDFESMLCKIRDDMSTSPQELYEQYSQLSDNVYNDIIQINEDQANVPQEKRKYSAKNYNKFMEEFEGELKEKRKNIREMMRKTTNTDVRRQYDNPEVLDTLSKREIKSAIRELEKYRDKVKNAKQASTLKDIIGNELDNLKKETEYRCNSLKSDWNSAKEQYKRAIDEIKRFFSNGGSSDQFIDDCCDRINQDFNAIKDLCKSLGDQLICCSIKVFSPSDIGPVVPNPVYKISDFIDDIKTIFTFIKNVIEKVVDIITHINKIARIMLNGLNNLKEIVNELTQMLGMNWLLDLIQKIINSFGNNIKGAKASLINNLSPVYFSDTNEYEHALEALEEISTNESISKNNSAALDTAIDILNNLPKTDDAVKALKGLKSAGKNKLEEKLEEAFDELEDEADTIVAYKSPIVDMIGSSDTTVSTLIDGGTLDNDLKFIGWHFFHPNLNHTGNTYYGNGLFGKILKKIKNRIIKKASKTGSKKRGGINGMKSVEQGGVGRWSVKNDSAYDVFYWYTYYTEDLEKDCFEWVSDNANQGNVYIDNVVQTENGSIVEVEGLGKVFVADTSIRGGDYVNVNGKRYRVKK